MTFHLAVVISPNVTEVAHQPLQQLVYELIAAHLLKREERAKDLHLIVTVQGFSTNEIQAMASLSLEGISNGLPFQAKSFAKRTTTGVHGDGGAAGIVGALATLAVSAALQASLSPGKEPYLMQCLSECVADLSLAIDKAIGQEDSGVSLLWQWIERLRWFAAIAGVVLITIPSIWFMGPRGVLSGLCSGVFIAPALFLIVHVVGLGLMPSRFFLHDPRGQRQMARSGVKSILLMRIICFVLVLPFAFFLLAGIGFGIEAMTTPPPQGPPQFQKAAKP